MNAVMKILAVVGLLFILIVAHLMFSGDETAPEPVAETEEAETDETPAENSAASIDKGDFVVVYEEPTDEAQAVVYNILRQEGKFKLLLDGMNEVIALPNHIPVRFRSCGEANAYYNPENRDLSMCYELFLDYINIFDNEEMTGEELGEKVTNAAMFIMFHEIGHCLVHNLNIPITGKEEDAVDDFAAVFAVNMDEVGEGIIADSIVGFGAWADNEEIDNRSFADEHSLSAQRFYSIACILYGSNPEKYASLVDQEVLPKDRADRCPAEYQQKNQSWSLLLTPYLK